MGPYLTTPNKTKDSVDGENVRFKYGATGMQGWRNTMEDTHLVELDLGDGNSFFGVYDGHGGHEVAQFVKENLVRELKQLPSYKAAKYEQSLKDIYIKIDQLLQTDSGKKKLQEYRNKSDSGNKPMFGGDSSDIASAVGCTACSALILQNEIIVANSGDSRAVLGKRVGSKLQSVELSQDHKPENKEEKERIEKAEGFVEDNRVNGILNLSRSIGDLEYKNNPRFPIDQQLIIAMPEIKKEPFTTDAEFLIIACDGIWDCLSSQEAVEYVGEFINKNDKVSSIIENMFDKIIATDVASSGGIGCDNMTCCIVLFKKTS